MGTKKKEQMFFFKKNLLNKGFLTCLYKYFKTEEIKMSVSFSLLTIFEVALGIFFIWGFWNEDKVADFEDKIFAKMGIVRRKKYTAKITKFSVGSSSKGDRNCI